MLLAAYTKQDHTDDEEIDLEDIYGEDYQHREKGETMLRRMRAEDLHVQELMRRLAEEYPGDIGIMMPLLLNYMRMGEGESFFMAANEPHAYLKGDIMEVRGCALFIPHWASYYNLWSMAFFHRNFWRYYTPTYLERKYLVCVASLVWHASEREEIIFPALRSGNRNLGEFTG